MGGMLLTINTATIDTGDMNKTLHGFCASRFFIVTFIAQIYNTVVVAWMAKQTIAISKTNLHLKYFVLVLLAVQGIYSSMKVEGD